MRLRDPIKGRALGPCFSYQTMRPPIWPSDNPDHHLQEEEPQAGSVAKQMLIKELTKHQKIVW